MPKQFPTTFFQFITFKGRCGERDRTVKNPSEAFNLLLQQNFISTLIFFRARERRAEIKMRSSRTIETNISCFCRARNVRENFFFTTMEASRERQRNIA